MLNKYTIINIINVSIFLKQHLFLFYRKKYSTNIEKYRHFVLNNNLDKNHCAYNK